MLIQIKSFYLDVKLQREDVMKHVLEAMPGIEIHQGNVADLLEEGGRALGVTTSLGLEIRGRYVAWPLTTSVMPASGDATRPRAIRAPPTPPESITSCIDPPR